MRQMSVPASSRDTMHRNILLLEDILADGRTEGLVSDTEHHNDVSVLGLGDELGEDADVVKRTLGVGNTHRAEEDVDLPQTAGVVPTVL